MVWAAKRLATIAAAVAGLAASSSGACSAPERYLGVSLEPGQDPQLAALARAARAGDPQAQIGLAARFERNLDLDRAERLYRAASASARDEAVRAQARSGWIRARSERLALEAAAAAPRRIAQEVYYARKLAAQRALGDPAALALPVAGIDGPVTISGRFVAGGTERGDSELCRAAGALIRHYWPWGFEDCLVEHFSRAGGARRGEPTLVALSYDDRHQDDPGYMGHPHEFSWPAYALALTLGGTERPFCGRFRAFDFVLASGARYRLIHSAATAGRDGGRGCGDARRGGAVNP